VIAHEKFLNKMQKNFQTNLFNYDSGSGSEDDGSDQNIDEKSNGSTFVQNETSEDDEDISSEEEVTLKHFTDKNKKKKKKDAKIKNIETTKPSSYDYDKEHLSNQKSKIFLTYYKKVIDIYKYIVIKSYFKLALA
jgi:flagellar motor protein MotB